MKSFKITFIFIAIFQFAYSQELKVLSFTNVHEMYAYFKYQPDMKIISGHRGTVERGFPENSIAGMQEVLQYTTAIFEVDPRLTKDSIAVIVHDDTLDRTTTGKGKVKDYTLAELQKLNLKDVNGNISKYKIPTLEQMIIWAKGKTILNLDKKDLPLQMTADIIKKQDAYSWIWVTVHNVEQAKFYLAQNPNQYLSMHIKTPQALQEFKDSGLPYDRMIVYIGSKLLDSNQEYISFFKEKGVICMMSSAPTYDKLSTVEERIQMYKEVFESGVTILESDFPIELSKGLKIKSLD